MQTNENEIRNLWTSAVNQVEADDGDQANPEFYNGLRLDTELVVPLLVEVWNNRPDYWRDDYADPNLNRPNELWVYTYGLRLITDLNRLEAIIDGWGGEENAQMVW